MSNTGTKTNAAFHLPMNYASVAALITASFGCHLCGSAHNAGMVRVRKIEREAEFSY